MPKKTAQNSTVMERNLQRTCEAYAVAGIAIIEKCEAPTRTFGTGRRKRTVHLANPFLDFNGAWTELGGKRLELEAKFTSDPTLSITKDDGNGIKQSQLEAALRWEQAGAAVAFLWQWENHGVRLATPAMVVRQLTKRKSLRWCDTYPVPQGEGFILIDFLALLRRIHKAPNHQHTDTP